MIETRIASKDQLIELMRIAKQRSYNRQLSNDVIGRLDDQGVNILSVALLHEHARGKKVTPHYRCWVLLKFSDDSEPQRVQMDVPIESFNALTLAKVAR